MTVPALPQTSELPWYQPSGEELLLFEHCYQQRLPLLLKGPTGCGKSRFVEHMAARLKRPLITVPCHDDTSTADLLGRWLVRGGDTVWVDGPVTRALRQGAVLYLDEIAEARPDVLVALHPLTDHRRELFLERHDEVLAAPDSFMLVASFNPHYQQGLKTLKPSTRQRFVAMSFDYPSESLETKVLLGETSVDAKTARRLVKLGRKLRELDALGLAEKASTRLLVDAAHLIASGLNPRLACQCAIAEPLSDEKDVLEALGEIVALAF